MGLRAFYERSFVAGKGGFSYPPFLFELHAATHSVSFLMPLGALDSPFWMFPSSWVSLVEALEALHASLLRDLVFAPVMNPASFEFAFSSHYWVCQEISHAGCQTVHCLPFGLGAGFAIPARLTGGRFRPWCLLAVGCSVC